MLGVGRADRAVGRACGRHGGWCSVPGADHCGRETVTFWGG